jgi:L-fuconolactonase
MGVDGKNLFLMRIDAHQHFWNYDPKRDAWITPEMEAIRHDFLPQHLAPLLDAANLQGCVSVQADQSETETQFLVNLAQTHAFIKGVVGWVDLASDRIEDRLDYWKQFPIVKGFRHIVQGESDPAFLQGFAFNRGIGALTERGFTYDILVYPHQLESVRTFVAAHPKQSFILDHLAKPYMAKKEIVQWQLDMEALAAYPNVVVKVSGMVTEADWKSWKPADFTPYLDVVYAAFGPDRLLYGSDWPVCLVAGSYACQLHVVIDYFNKKGQEVFDKVMGMNAVRIYGL